MQNNYTVLEIQKVKSFKAMRGLAMHNNRTHISSNVDTSLSMANESLVPCYSDLDREWKERLLSAETEFKKKINYKNDAVLMLEIVTGMSHGADKDIDIPKWAEKNKQWMFDTFGEKNVLGCTLHMDESTPHIHTEVIPLTQDGRLCAKDLIGGKWKLSKLQTDYADAMSEFGLVRGKRKSKAKKKSLNKFYQEINYAETIEPPRPLENESVNEYYIRARKYLRNTEMENLRLRDEVSNLKLNQEEKLKDFMAEYSAAISLQRALGVSFSGKVILVEEYLNRLTYLVTKTPAKILMKALSFLETKLLPPKAKEKNIENIEEEDKEAGVDLD